MAVLWNPAGDLPARIKGDVLNEVITAVDDVVGAPLSYMVVSHDFPSSAIVTASSTGVFLTGDLSDTFPTTIKYVVWTTPGEVAQVADVPDDADPYSFIPNPAMSTAFSVTVRAEFEEQPVEGGGSSSTETIFVDQTFFMSVTNNLDAHRQQLLQLMERYA